MFISPTYIIVFTIYSICNIHDVSWGNRPAGKDQKESKQDKEKAFLYENYRANYLMVYLVLNLLVGSVIAASFRVNLYDELGLGDVDVTQRWWFAYLKPIALIGTFSVFIIAINLVKIISSTLFWAQQHCTRNTVERRRYS